MSVDSPSREYLSMAHRWRQMRDCIAGSHAVKAAGTTYLPALEGHNPNVRTDPYWDFNSRALYYNATGRTIDGLEGMVFRRPPIIDLPPAAAVFVADIDLQGQTLEEFAAATLREVISVGRVGLLVDHTRRPEAEDLGLERERLGFGGRLEQRPYLVMYATEAILDVVYEVEGSARRPVQVRLREIVEVPGDQEFESALIDQVRVLEMIDGAYQQRVFRREVNATTFIERVDLRSTPTDASGRPFDRIPFWVVGTGRSTTPGKIEPPPLLDLSDVNLCHYRQEADYRNALHMAGVPTLFVSGMTPPDGGVRVGTAEVCFMPPADAKAYFVSYGAEGAAAIQQALLDLQQMMAFLGARMLQPDKRGIEAAETARIHRMGEVSVLARISHSVDSVLTIAVKTLLAWAGIATTDEHRVGLNDDFMPTQAAPQLLAEMIKGWQEGLYSHDSVWRFSQEGELVDPRRTVEQEIAIISEEKMAKMVTVANRSGSDG